MDEDEFQCPYIYTCTYWKGELNNSGADDGIVNL